MAKTLKDIGHAPNVNYFVKTDVSDYYASLGHFRIFQQLEPYIGCDQTRRLSYLAIKSREGEIGLPRGSPLSYVLGNFYLHGLDVIFEGRETQHYFRYMDDILLLSEKKGALRRGIKTIKQTFEQSGLHWAHHKLLIGRVGCHQTVFLGTTLFAKDAEPKL